MDKISQKQRIKNTEQNKVTNLENKNIKQSQQKEFVKYKTVKKFLVKQLKKK